MSFKIEGYMQISVVEGGAFGLKLRLIDTPGLHPASGSQRKNEKILAKINRARSKHKPDLVIYCERLDMVSCSFQFMQSETKQSVAPMKADKRLRTTGSTRKLSACLMCPLLNLELQTKQVLVDPRASPTTQVKSDETSMAADAARHVRHPAAAPAVGNAWV